MSAEVFYPSARCPLCGNAAPALLGRQNGHWVCPCGQSRIVISPHGQFVRDPFRPSSNISIQQLRRQSRPLSRLLRDTPIQLWAIGGGLALAAIGVWTWPVVTSRGFHTNPSPPPAIHRDALN
jgi:hypothetical protein